MHSTHGLSQFHATALVALLLAAGPAQAGLSCADLSSGNEHRRMSVPAVIQLERVGTRELSRGLGPSGTVPFRLGLIRPKSVHRIIRRIPDLWQRKIPSTISPLALRVSYRLLVKGRAAREAHHSDVGDRRLPVALRPLAPVTVCRGGGQQIVQGGVILEFAAVGLPTAGRYRIEIEPTVELP